MTRSIGRCLVALMFAACAPEPPPKTAETVESPAALGPLDPCKEIFAALAPLANAKPPERYPFEVRLPPPAERGAELCKEIGTPCASIAFDPDLGTIDRIELSLPPTQEDRSRERTRVWALDAVRKLRSELGLHVMPRSWSVLPDGSSYFSVDPADGIGVVTFSLEARPEADAPWRGAIELVGLTGVSRRDARVISQDEAAARLLGRHYCEEVPAGDAEERSETASEPATRREVRTLTETPSFRLMLLKSRTKGTVRVVWAGLVTVDAFTGESVDEPDAVLLQAIREVPPAAEGH